MCGWVRELDIQNEERAGRNAATEAIELLIKWHNWIATGQLYFRKDHLEESEKILRACGRGDRLVRRAESGVSLAEKHQYLREEHKLWAKTFGAALILALQGDYSEVDKLAREVRFEFVDGEPAIKSEVSHVS